MEPRISIITLCVDDLPMMRSFYIETFGWKPTDDSNENITFFKLNGSMLALYGCEALAEEVGISADREALKSFTLSHNLRSTEEVDELFVDLEKKGANIVKPPEKVFWGGYSGYVSDPEGNLWEIAYNPHLELDDRGNVT